MSGRSASSSSAAISASSRCSGASSAAGAISTRVDVLERALGEGGEPAQPLHLVAEQLDAHRALLGGRVDVEDAAAHRELPAVLDLVLALVAARHEPLGGLVEVEQLPPLDREAVRAQLRVGDPLRQRAGARHHDRPGVRLGVRRAARRAPRSAGRRGAEAARGGTRSGRRGRVEAHRRAGARNARRSAARSRAPRSSAATTSAGRSGAASSSAAIRNGRRLGETNARCGSRGLDVRPRGARRPRPRGRMRAVREGPWARRKAARGRAAGSQLMSRSGRSPGRARVTGGAETGPLGPNRPNPFGSRGCRQRRRRLTLRWPRSSPPRPEVDVHLKAADLERATAFYRDALGFTGRVGSRFRHPGSVPRVRRLPPSPGAEPLRERLFGLAPAGNPHRPHTLGWSLRMRRR